MGSVAWGDYDNDGRLDFLLTGTTNGVVSGQIAQVWRNISAVPKTPSPAPPVITHAEQAGTDLVFTGTGGTAGATYHVLASTNLAGGMTNWSCVATNTFGVGGTFNVTNALGPDRPRQFFRLEVH
jgi:hypothetical protein